MYYIEKNTPITLITGSRHTNYAIIKTVNGIFHAIAFEKPSAELQKPYFMQYTGPSNSPSYRLTINGYRRVYSQSALCKLYHYNGRSLTDSEVSSLVKQLSHYLAIREPSVPANSKPKAETKAELIATPSDNAPVTFNGGYVIAKIVKGNPAFASTPKVHSSAEAAAAEAERLAKQFPGETFVTFKAAAEYVAQTVSSRSL
jgi:hypothetical protein